MKPSFKNNKKNQTTSYNFKFYFRKKQQQQQKKQQQQKNHFFPFPTLEALYKNSTYILLEHLKILFIKIYQDFHTKPLNGENFYLRKHLFSYNEKKYRISFK